MLQNQQDLVNRCRALAPGCYTERDGGNWYALNPAHLRMAEDFARRDDARRFILWLAGDPMPAGWEIRPNGDGTLSFDIECGQGFPATLWIREVQRTFCDRAKELRR